MGNRLGRQFLPLPQNSAHPRVGHPSLPQTATPAPSNPAFLFPFGNSLFTREASDTLVRDNNDPRRNVVSFRYRRVCTNVSRTTWTDRRLICRSVTERQVTTLDVGGGVHRISSVFGGNVRADVPQCNHNDTKSSWRFVDTLPV